MSLASTVIRLVAVVVLGALTAGCFYPMYAEHTDGTPDLREKLMGVEIPPVDKPNGSREARIGVEIRNALAFKLYGNATGLPPTYRLVLRFATTRSSLMIDPNTALPTSVTYDMPGSYQRFSRSRAYRDAEDRAAQEIAENIGTRLASFFSTGT